MDCASARSGLWPPERPRLAGGDVVAARRHVEACPECRDFFAQDRALLEVYHRLQAVEAPRRARERVFDALAEARWRSPATGVARQGEVRASRSVGALLWPVAAAVAVATFGWAWQTVPGAPLASATEPADGAMFVEDYLRRAVGQDHIVTSDPEEVGRFLTRELGIPVRAMSRPGLELERAEICLLEGRRGAMIVYKKDGVAVAHYLVPRAGAPPRPPTISAAASASDLPVVTWSSAAVEQAVVAELEPAELLRLAGG